MFGIVISGPVFTITMASVLGISLLLLIILLIHDKVVPEQKRSRPWIKLFCGILALLAFIVLNVA